MKKKRCPKCERTRDITCFYRDTSRRDKLTAVCRDCRRKASLAYYRSAVQVERRARDKAILDAEHADADPIRAAVDEGDRRKILDNTMGGLVK